MSVFGGKIIGGPSLSSEMSNSTTDPEVLNEILSTLKQLIRSHQVESSTSASKSSSDDPGPSSSSGVQRSSSCERALEFMREIRTGTRAAIEGEQRHNFGPYVDKGKRRKRSSVSATGECDLLVKRKAQSGEDRPVWWHKFVCLANRKQVRVPTPSEKSILTASDLGEKTIYFSSLEFTYGQTVAVLVEAFPKLSAAGGIEFLKCPSNSRDLAMIKLGAGGIPLQLSLKCGHGRIYIRPIQCNLELLPIESNEPEVRA